jgi:hypothetical protein
LEDELTISDEKSKLISYDEDAGIVFLLNYEKRMTERYIKLYSVKLREVQSRDSDSEDLDKSKITTPKYNLVFSFISEVRLDVGTRAFQIIEKQNLNKGKGVASSKFPVTFLAVLNPGAYSQILPSSQIPQSLFVYLNIYDRILVFDRPID